MSVIGIVCEYNPFHRGHEYHISKSRELAGGDAAVLCVMSGDFVQRGEAAVFSKFARAEAACRCGADAVFELPPPWALSSAEGFARGAVYMLAELGCDRLSFGSEAGELGPLDWIAQCILEPDFQQSVRDLLELDGSLSYAAARQRALEESLGSTAALISRPNNILAVEYLKAIYELSLSLRPMTLPRLGSGHDDESAADGCSASALRRLLAQGRDISPYVPEAALQVFRREEQLGRTRRDKDALELAVVSRLRMLEEERFAALPDAADGAGQRLYAAVREQPGLDAIVAAARSKRYPVARMRRMCMCAALGLTAEMSRGLPSYARLLAANERGRALLRSLGESCRLPVITKPASVKACGEDVQRLFATGVSAHDLFVLGYAAQEERKGGNDWRIGPKIV